jgi:LytS/YehU family sensor histidine kinase
VQHYVALEQLRLGPRVEVSLSFSGPLSAYAVAPLLLLPFVENAFRHVTGNQLECSWVSIDLVVNNNFVIFKIINSQAGVAAAVREGPGLGHLRQRLARLYPGRHALKVVAEPDSFLVTLHLNMQPAPAAPPQPAGGPPGNPPRIPNQP